ncbi:MAG: hypothetical protein ACE5I7_08010 [Candidatus Binatia bacterium]
MRRRAQPWLGHTEEVDDAARYAAMSPEERVCCFGEVAQLARLLLDGRPDRNEVLAAR